MTELSIIIPSYNSGERLAATLRSIADAAKTFSAGPEVVVVDDGSDDETRLVVDAARARMGRLKYVFRPRDGLSCRARARNLGIDASTGAALLFLDAGVVVTPGLLSTSLRHATEAPTAVLVYRTLAVHTHAGQPPINYSGPGMLEKLVASQSRRWRDIRDAYLDALDCAGPALPAPWLLAWSCALGVPREAALAVHGFDDGYLGWGVEDADFAARLHQHGLSFRCPDEAIALHIPHERAADCFHDHQRNASRLHQKLCTRETELFNVWLDGFKVNLFAARLDQLCLARLMVPYSFRVAEAVPRRDGRLICLGLRWSEDVMGLSPDVVLCHEPRTLKRLSGWCSRPTYHCLLGVRLPFADNEFEHAIMGDLVSLLPSDLQREQFREVGRIARRASLILSSRPQSDDGLYCSVAGWCWSPMEEVFGAARSVGLSVVGLRELGSRAVVAEVSADQAARGE